MLNRTAVALTGFCGAAESRVLGTWLGVDLAARAILQAWAKRPAQWREDVSLAMESLIRVHLGRSHVRISCPRGNSAIALSAAQTCWTGASQKGRCHNHHKRSANYCTLPTSLEANGFAALRPKTQLLLHRRHWALLRPSCRSKAAGAQHQTET